MTVEFAFIGWSTEGTSDKIWGYFYRSPQTTDPRDRYRGNPNHGRHVCRFWGRRGKAMQFKADISGEDLDKINRTKLNDGYVKIDQNKLMAIWPAFIEEAEAKLMWAVLAGEIK